MFFGLCCALVMAALQTLPRHPFHQWELKPTGFCGVKVPLGWATFLPAKMPIHYML
jgi:hypothetical protein